MPDMGQSLDGPVQANLLLQCRVGLAQRPLGILVMGDIFEVHQQHVLTVHQQCGGVQAHPVRHAVGQAHVHVKRTGLQDLLQVILTSPHQVPMTQLGRGPPQRFGSGRARQADPRIVDRQQGTVTATAHTGRQRRRQKQGLPGHPADHAGPCLG